MTPFDFVNAINSAKKPDLMTDTENDEIAEKAYVPFVVNRALSYFPDSILFANTMNIHGILDNKLQFHYLLNTIRPGKRFAKWAKKQDNDLQLIMQYYNYSADKAKQALSILSEEQISTIKTIMQSGIQNDDS